MPAGDFRLLQDMETRKMRVDYSFRPPIVDAEFQAAFQRVSEALVAELSEAESKLTEQQFIEAMRQALTCGDFTRFVVAHSDQSGVTYVPFREHTRLRTRIRELEDKLAAIGKLLQNEPEPLQP